MLNTNCHTTIRHILVGCKRMTILKARINTKRNLLLKFFEFASVLNKTGMPSRVESDWMLAVLGNSSRFLAYCTVTKIFCFLGQFSKFKIDI